MQKCFDEKCLYSSFFFCFLTLHAGTGGIPAQVSRLFNCRFSFSKSHFELVVRSDCQKQPKEPSIVEDSDLSEVEPFITQTKAALMAVLQLSFLKTILKLHLRVQTTSKQLTISIFAPRIFRPTCMFTDKEDSGRWFSTVTAKEIQSRNEARIPQNTRGQLHVFIAYRSLG